MNSLPEAIDDLLKRDLNQTLGYHSWVLTKHKALFIAVPKNACSRIKLTLHILEGNPAPLELGHIHGYGLRLSDFKREKIVEILTSPDWFRFCFVRNPYKRLVSAYITQVGNIWNKQYQWLKDSIKHTFGYRGNDRTQERIVCFRDFVQFVCSAKEEVQRDGHFNLQSRILMTDLIEYSMVGRFENFQMDFEKVLRRLEAPSEIIQTAGDVKNATTSILPSLAYDMETADITFRHFRKDFEVFGYDRESWMHL